MGFTHDRLSDTLRPCGGGGDTQTERSGEDLGEVGGLRCVGRVAVVRGRWNARLLKGVRSCWPLAVAMRPFWLFPVGI